MPPPHLLPPGGDVAINKTYKIKKSEKDIIALLSELDFEYDTILTLNNFGHRGFFNKKYENTGFYQYASQSYFVADSFDRKDLIEMDTIGIADIDSLILKNRYQKTKVLRNVKFEKRPLLKYVFFSINDNSKANGKPRSEIEIHSIVFSEKVHGLNRYKKLKKLRRLYKRIIRKKIIREIKR